MVLVVKNLPVSAGDIRNAGSIPGFGRCPEGGHGNPLQYSHPWDSQRTPWKEEPGGLPSIGWQRVACIWGYGVAE